MDLSKSANAPPSNWSDEKSTMGHPPPPPYQDQGYPPQPGQGYPPQPGQGYSPQPGPGYPPQQPGYGPVPPQYGGQQQYLGQAPVTVQPVVYVTRGPLEHPVNDYLCYSIFILVCCCMPLGIAALIYSISTREANHIGDQMAAERSSRTARKLNHIGLGIGIGVLILSIVYAVVMTSMAFN